MRLLNTFALAFALVVSCACFASDSPELVRVLARIRTERPSVKWDAKSTVSGDFDSSGHPEFAVLGYEGKGIVLAIGRISGTGAVLTQYLPFDVSAASQAAICALPARLRAVPLVCSAQTEDDLLPGCRVHPSAAALSLEGGDCDPINLYWDHDHDQMAWWRN
jgi:hypothetical protein